MRAWASGSEANSPAQGHTAETTDFQKKVQKIPLQSPVQLRLTDREKLLGKMTEVSDQGLTVRTVIQDKVVDRHISPNELKSIRVMGFPGGDPSLSLKQKVLLVPEGALTKVRLRDNQKLQGVIENVSDEGFVLRSRDAGQLQSRTLAFADVQSLTMREKTSKKTYWILAGAVAGIIVLGIIPAHVTTG